MRVNSVKWFVQGDDGPLIYMEVSFKLFKMRLSRISHCPPGQNIFFSSFGYFVHVQIAKSVLTGVQFLLF